MSNILMHRNNHNVPFFDENEKTFNDLMDSVFGNWITFPLTKSFNLSNKVAEPKIEVKETDKDIFIRAELPGISENDINLEVSEDGYIILSGEKKQEKEEHFKGSYFSEISYGSFSRTIPLPLDLKYKDAKADFENGILKVSIPKSDMSESRKKKILINKK